jgi:hypothetical protein
MLFSYKITDKVATGYTPYQLVYGLYLLMPCEATLCPSTPGSMR